MIKIIKNCISEELQNSIKELLLSNNFAWYYLNDITSYGENQNRMGFSHYFYVLESGINSEHFKTVLPILKNIKYKNVLQSRGFLQVPLNKKLINKDYDTPHVDLNYSHTALLYYVKTSDGDTVFLENDKIVKRVSPEKGKCVIFDGSILHTAYQPTKEVRCIINFDVST